MMLLFLISLTLASAIWPLFAPSKGKRSTTYTRETPPPIVWTHLRKSKITSKKVPRLETLLDAALNATRPVPFSKSSQKPTVATPASFLQANPLMLRNGLYLSRPIRRPPQAFVNVAVAENVEGIAGERFARAQENETKRLQKEFSMGLSHLIDRGELKS